MLYVRRDQNNNIVAIYNSPADGATEEVSSYSEEVMAFLLEGQSETATTEFLSHTDTHVVRVVEDLIDLLIKKNIIMLTELPAGAQMKLNRRQRAREKLHDLSLIIDRDDIL